MKIYFNKIIIELTKHAKEKIAIEGISIEDVEIAILRGTKTKQTDGYLACYTYYCVAYKIIRDKVYKVKTVYVE